MVSPLTHTEGLRHSVTSVGREKDVDDDNGNELARTRRRHSLDTWHDHSGLPGVTCEAVRRRRGRACVAPRPRWASGGAGLALTGHSERVPLILCARWLSPEPTDHVRYRTCADVTVRPPKPSAGAGTWIRVS